MVLLICLFCAGIPVEFGSDQPVQIMLTTTRPERTNANLETQTYGLTRRDIARIKESVPKISRLVVWRSMPHQLSSSSSQRPLDTQIIGATPELRAIAKLNISRGRFITKRDDNDKAKVLVLDETLADELFPLENPIGKTVAIGRAKLVVVGVFDDVADKSELGERPRCILPFKTMQNLFGDLIVQRKNGKVVSEKYELTGGYVEMAPQSDVAATRKVIQAIIDRYHKTKDVKVRVKLPGSDQ